MPITGAHSVQTNHIQNTHIASNNNFSVDTNKNNFNAAQSADPTKSDLKVTVNHLAPTGAKSAFKDLQVQDQSSQSSTQSLQTEKGLSDLLSNIAKSVNIEKFDVQQFCSGCYQEQKNIINDLASTLIKHANERDGKPDKLLREILTEVKLNPKNIEDSTNFALRSAILQASEITGVGIQSWDVYTKGGGPAPNDKEFWSWVEQPKSWVEEAQAAALKFSESAFIKALRLAQETPGNAEVILYKGGFGAGKTTHSQERFDGLADGVVAPDKGKTFIRKTMNVTHAAAHVQGSNTTYNLFMGMINNLVGPIVYDSALSNPKEIEAFLKKADFAPNKSMSLNEKNRDSESSSSIKISQLTKSNSGKEMIGKPARIIDVTRNDIARSLAVLSREIGGEDPRTPVGLVINGAARDRANRAACMNTVLNYKPDVSVREDKKSNLFGQHHYELHVGNESKMGTTHVLTINPGYVGFHINQEQADKALASQGVKYNAKENQFEPISTEVEWKNYLTEQFQKNVAELTTLIGKGEAEFRSAGFAKRTIQFSGAQPITTVESLYQAADDKFKDSISLVGFRAAFDELPIDKHQQVIEGIINKSIEKGHVSYLDLPYILAAGIHQRLQSDPFIK
ncbi:hypothetical protein [Spartinivicinus poritis]|uniref:Uncharacterized protein n=1 Tax=Spartinivicinus poritis TaxID=2994640 RepID=A0ABT5UHE9_9GAMM|nr:hypothetical protein [Spartinivicinus sp. A2-2]MDE1464444.1 hypothetical protein [Spartinivicinus sp. A2-2]